MAGLVIAARAANNRIGVSRAGRINNQLYVIDGHQLEDSVNQLYDSNNNEQLLINQPLT